MSSKNKGLDFGGMIARDVSALMQCIPFRFGGGGYKT